MRAAQRTIVLYVFVVACTCAASATEEEHFDDIEEPQQQRQRPPQLARKLWDCVDDNNTLTCFKDVFYEEFDSKVMRNPNVEVLKKYVNKYMAEYVKRSKRFNQQANYYRQDNVTEPPENSDNADGDGEDDDEGHRGMKKKMMDFLPYLLAPALLMAGIMPWVLPPLKMMVMFVAMINNMAFSSALFSLIRNYVFNQRQDEHVFYINHGYPNQKHR